MRGPGHIKNVDGDVGRRRFIRQAAVTLGAIAFCDADVRHAWGLPRQVTPAGDRGTKEQGYLNAAPVGIDARWAWTRPNGAGQNVGFVDIEQGWLLALSASSTAQQHEDLPRLSDRLRVSRGVPRTMSRDTCPQSLHHGSAVLGVVAGTRNSIGVTGIAPEVASVEVASHKTSPATRGDVANAIDKVLPFMAPGDVLLIEHQDDNSRPSETVGATFSAIRRAIARGVIVIEPAGNFNVDLDSVNSLNPSHARFRDSGAIIVGACNMPDSAGNGRTRWVTTPSDFPLASSSPAFLPFCGGVPPMLPGSNYGARVDCYAWGEGIVSAGYGWLGGTMPTNSYTNRFGGTSGAAAIVAGAAVVIQSLHKHAMGRPLTPSEMRTALRANGTPQQPSGATQKIGVMPDVRKVASALGI